MLTFLDSLPTFSTRTTRLKCALRRSAARLYESRRCAPREAMKSHWFPGGYFV